MQTQQQSPYKTWYGTIHKLKWCIFEIFHAILHTLPSASGNLWLVPCIWIIWKSMIYCVVNKWRSYPTQIVGQGTSYNLLWNKREKLVGTSSVVVKIREPSFPGLVLPGLFAGAVLLVTLCLVSVSLMKLKPESWLLPAGLAGLAGLAVYRCKWKATSCCR